jgi:hypothetical protein
MLPFAAARATVRTLELKSVKEWEVWRKAGKRPSNIPSDPARTYRDDGWISMPDWLGKEGERGMSGGIKGISRMLPFAAARAIVRKLNLKGDKEWQAWRKAGQRPSNIPSNPYKRYRDDGWISLPDWLGKKGGQGAMLPFAAARTIVRKLTLKSKKEWRAWSKSGQRPSNIPSLPSSTYRDDGWISLPDWLGYTGVTQHKDMLPFAAARAIVRKLEIKSVKEWEVWRKAGQRPSNIPSHPERMYRDDGWISWPDWLGKEEVSEASEASEASEVGAARRTSGACAKRSVCEAERVRSGASKEMVCQWTPLLAGDRERRGIGTEGDKLEG